MEHLPPSRRWSGPTRWQRLRRSVVPARSRAEILAQTAGVLLCYLLLLLVPLQGAPSAAYRAGFLTAALLVYRLVVAGTTFTMRCAQPKYMRRRKRVYSEIGLLDFAN